MQNVSYNPDRTEESYQRIEDLLAEDHYTVLQHKVTKAEGRQSAVYKFGDEELYTTRVIRK